MLEVAPCIPKAWPGFEITYRAGAATYRIRVSNPQHVSTGVVRVEVDGKVTPDGAIRLANDSGTHDVTVVLGQASSEQAQATPDRRMGRLGT